MKKGFKNGLLVTGLFLASLTISSCACSLFEYLVDSTVNGIIGENDSGTNIEVTNNVTPNQEFEYKDKENETISSRWTYSDVMSNGSDISCTPSLGTVNILVVPIQFRDLSNFSSAQKKAIQSVFNGSNSDGTNSYWESVSSYYKKTSYENLDLNFDVCDPFVPSYTSTMHHRYNRGNGEEVDQLLDEIYNNSSKLTLNGTKVDLEDASRYDANKDNFIDGIWLVYNEANSRNVDADHFWAYCSNYYGDYLESGEKKLTFGKYANAAMSFMYSDSLLGYDAHTFIHETGHMFGLDDYYSYDLDGSKNGHIGGLDMMDLNIGDHSAFSKFSLGWIDAEIMYQESSKFTLRPFSSTGDCVILPANYFNGTAFSEYIILEYYVPDGLNKLDANKGYTGSYPKMYNKSGILAYHVDARLMKQELKYKSRLNDYEKSFVGYVADTVENVPTADVVAADKFNAYPIANSNTPSMNNVNSTFSLVSLLSSTGNSTYGKGVSASTNDMYTAASSKNSFSIDLLNKFFANNSFNDGTKMSYKMTVESLGDEAIIKVER